RGFRILIACIALGVMAIAGVGSVAASLTDGLAREGRVILGGDLALSLIHREASAAERQFLANAGTVSAVATLRAMAATVPGLSPPPLLERLVAAGHRGKKAGAGFYRHGRLANAANAAALPKVVADRDLEVAVRRTMARLLTAAFAALGTGLIRGADDLDGLLLGTGWPAFRGGPVRYAYNRGLPALVRTCDELAKRYGPRFDAGKELRRRAGEPAIIPMPRRAAA
ncbi:MAG TPA: hypothetical protein VGF55_15585, partial [Gemmataceae bacterium]